MVEEHEHEHAWWGIIHQKKMKSHPGGPISHPHPQPQPQIQSNKPILPYLAPDAPRGVEVGKDVLVVPDVRGELLGVDRLGVLPVLVEGVEVCMCVGGVRGWV